MAGCTGPSICQQLFCLIFCILQENGLFFCAEMRYNGSNIMRKGNTEYMKIMGVDYGDARTGIAISDLMCSIVGSTYVVPSRNREKAVADIVRLVKDNMVGEIVVGLPRNMDGTEGLRAELCREFAEVLEEATGVTPINSKNVHNPCFFYKKQGRSFTTPTLFFRQTHIIISLSAAIPECGHCW